MKEIKRIPYKPFHLKIDLAIFSLLLTVLITLQFADKL